MECWPQMMHDKSYHCSKNVLPKKVQKHEGQLNNIFGFSMILALKVVQKDK